LAGILPSDFKEVGKELKGPLDDARKPFTEIGKQLGDTTKGYEWKGPKPLSGPTPADAMRDLEEMNAATEIDRSVVDGPGEELETAPETPETAETDRSAE
jgi:hypothetical protein